MVCLPVDVEVLDLVILVRVIQRVGFYDTYIVIDPLVEH